MKGRAKFKPPLRGEDQKLYQFSIETFSAKPLERFPSNRKKMRKLVNPFINLTFLHQGHRHDKQGAMPDTGDEMKALRLLLREELQAEVRPLRNEMSSRFDEVATQIDGLYQRDEKRDQEYLAIREQLQRLEARVA